MIPNGPKPAAAAIVQKNDRFSELLADPAFWP
jgi:hypothetical protein